MRTPSGSPDGTKMRSVKGSLMAANPLSYPTFTGTSVIVSLPKMSITLTATV
jgi:hypothetical protein